MVEVVVVLVEVLVVEVELDVDVVLEVLDDVLVSIIILSPVS